MSQDFITRRNNMWMNNKFTEIQITIITLFTTSVHDAMKVYKAMDVNLHPLQLEVRLNDWFHVPDSSS
jgi:hypothetical protein